jgi:hypothetical protein|tara:strand:- start:231 stop:812 length:582 start_codon:yes stop_codon:yes gene_type:complete
MAITKRLVKGSALSHAELDGNFTDYETFKALFDSTTFTVANNGKVLYWNNSTSNVEVKSITTSEITDYTTQTNTLADARINAVVTQSFVDGLYSSIAPQNSFEIKTASFNTANAKRYMVDTTGGVVTATLPASPSAGNTIEFTEGATAFSSNNLVIARNGSTIDGAASDLTVSSAPTGGMLSLIYDGTTWRSR